MYKLKYLSLLDYYYFIYFEGFVSCKTIFMFRVGKWDRGICEFENHTQMIFCHQPLPNCSGGEDQGHALSCLQAWLQLGTGPVLTEQSPTTEPTWFSYQALPNPGQAWLHLRLTRSTWLVCSFPQPSVGTFSYNNKIAFLKKKKNPYSLIWANLEIYHGCLLSTFFFLFFQLY